MMQSTPRAHAGPDVARSTASVANGCRLRAPASTPAAPPVAHEIVDHLAELADGTALPDDVAGRTVEGHHAVADPPAPLPLGVEPDDPLHPLPDQPQGPGLGIVVVVAGVAQDQDRRLAIERLQIR